MRKILRIRVVSASIAALLMFAGLPSSHAEEAKKPEDPLAKGKAIAFDQMRGNCLACHMIVGADLPGNIGPPLVGIKARYPDREKLRAQIYDSRTANPESVMPPFGAHGILTDEDLDLVTDYIHSL